MKTIALIPARSGSKRVKDKNIKTLGGIPLIAHTIYEAKKSGIFEEIFVLTDSDLYRDISMKFGADLFPLRPQETALDHSPDADWIQWFIKAYRQISDIDYLTILRPTSPFRNSETILRAQKEFMENFDRFDSLRAVAHSHLHPGKMWVKRGGQIVPVLPFETEKRVPWHSSQTASLNKVYYQNASMEMVKTSVVQSTGTLAGDFIYGFECDEMESVDINTELDFLFADFLIKELGLIL